ncbi:NEL-type E3 ubiquitin ligase domain-containing protein [Bradyrhizobium sp. BEA-2-5]|uniref:NEL-type E3 ubiquitin ligase domain-containing protein n=1 Tax=Bradyrhizobium sp. BEA-2-5 TaxID=3080015 RepID=UPI00293F489B|nr:NEL-type E3 ubiquitin ligase domain-containing protein [Bradyrhizobium sp. BEA-2-5]WOH80247.1 NEL-type E3 ubiquitin ligase domain-containing protein [Bradyrhizobium sp. BEA-2-5]
MDPFNRLNPSEIPDVGRTHHEGLQQQQADQAAFQQHLNELHPRERPPSPNNSNRRRPPYAGSNGDADHLGMPHEGRVGQGPSRLPSDPPSCSEQGINQHVLFATVDRDSQLPNGSFSLTDGWHDMDAAADWPTHDVDQEQHLWAGADDVTPEWLTIPASPWEQTLAASLLGQQPWPGDGNTSRGGRRLPPTAAHWTEALHRTGISAAGPASDPTNLEDPVLQEALLDRILDSWVCEERQTEDEDRQEAARRIRAWAEAGDVYARLELSDLGLTTLPAAFPPGLQSLNVSDNALVYLPDPLPAGLRMLTASGNRLSSLPDALPTQLQSLEVGSNRLTRLPETLPEGLLTLAVGSCSLTSLPDTLPAGLQDLDVRGNLLTSLPDALPSGLQLLAVGGNRLTDLPASLPPELQELEADGNRLTRLPDTLPAELQLLFARDNHLSSLPEALPPELQRLHVSGNRLTSLPETLPAELQVLEARDNRLTSLPEALLTRLGSGCMIYMEENLLSEQARTDLATALNAPGYAGPRVFFSMNEATAGDSARPLSDVVADWLEGEPKVIAAWQNFAGEAGASEYALFLDRLRKTVNYANPEFRNTVAEDLRQAAVRPGLRQQYFQLAFGASETCQDRITLTWNSMQTARLNADVEEGAYDKRLSELIQQARVLFRLDALEPIARQKVGSLQFVDEIEVYLAYQVKLRERLDLQLIAPDMRFFDVSYVTEDDLTAAEMQVRNEEGAGFADYLATRWHPWETVVSRIAPEAHAQMQDRLIEAMDEQFQSRLEQRLADQGLTGNSDAELQFGAKIRDEIACEIKGALMRQVLDDHALEL